MIIIMCSVKMVTNCRGTCYGFFGNVWLKIILCSILVITNTSLCQGQYREAAFKLASALTKNTNSNNEGANFTTINSYNGLSCKSFNTNNLFGCAHMCRQDVCKALYIRKGIGDCLACGCSMTNQFTTFGNQNENPEDVFVRFQSADGLLGKYHSP